MTACGKGIKILDEVVRIVLVHDWSVIVSYSFRWRAQAGFTQHYALNPVHRQWTDASLCVSGMPEKSSLMSLTNILFVYTACSLLFFAGNIWDCISQKLDITSREAIYTEEPAAMEFFHIFRSYDFRIASYFGLITPSQSSHIINMLF